MPKNKLSNSEGVILIGSFVGILWLKIVLLLIAGLTLLFVTKSYIPYIVITCAIFYGGCWLTERLYLYSKPLGITAILLSTAMLGAIVIPASVNYDINPITRGYKESLQYSTVRVAVPRHLEPTNFLGDVIQNPKPKTCAANDKNCLDLSFLDPVKEEPRQNGMYRCIDKWTPYEVDFYKDWNIVTQDEAWHMHYRAPWKGYCKSDL